MTPRYSYRKQFDWDNYWDDIEKGLSFKKRMKKFKRGSYVKAMSNTYK